MLRPVDLEITAWQRAFRDGIAPNLSDNELACLAEGIRNKDERIVNGCGIVPEPSPMNSAKTPTHADPVNYAIWVGNKDVQTVGDLEERSARVMFEADQILGQPAAVRYLLNWIDDNPLETTMPQLLALVEEIIRARAGALTEGKQ